MEAPESRTKEYYQTSLRPQAEEAVFSLDRHGCVTFWSQEAQKLYGLSREGVLGRSLTVLVREEKQPELRFALDRVLAGEELVRLLVPHEKCHGRVKQVEINLSPVKDRQGEVLAVSCFAHDISAKREVEEHRLAETHLQAKVDSLKVVIATLSHYLNNTMAVILGRTQMIDHCVGPEGITDRTGKLAPALTSIRKGTLKIAAVLEELRELSMSDHPQYFKNSQAFDLEHRLDERLKKMFPEFPELTTNGKNHTSSPANTGTDAPVQSEAGQAEPKENISAKSSNAEIGLAPHPLAKPDSVESPAEPLRLSLRAVTQPATPPTLAVPAARERGAERRWQKALGRSLRKLLLRDESDF